MESGITLVCNVAKPQLGCQPEMGFSHYRPRAVSEQVADMVAMIASFGL